MKVLDFHWPSTVLNDPPNREDPVMSAAMLSRLFTPWRRCHRLILLASWTVGITVSLVAPAALLLHVEHSFFVLIAALLLANLVALIASLLAKPRLLLLTKAYFRVSAVHFQPGFVFVTKPGSDKTDLVDLGNIDHDHLEQSLNTVRMDATSIQAEAGFLQNLETLKSLVLDQHLETRQAPFVTCDESLAKALVVGTTRHAPVKGRGLPEVAGPAFDPDALVALAGALRRFDGQIDCWLGVFGKIRIRLAQLQSEWKEATPNRFRYTSCFEEPTLETAEETSFYQTLNDTSAIQKAVDTVFQEAIAQQRELVRPILESIDMARQERVRAVQSDFALRQKQIAAHYEPRLRELDRDLTNARHEHEALDVECSSARKRVDSDKVRLKDLCNEKKRLGDRLIRVQADLDALTAGTGDEGSSNVETDELDSKMRHAKDELVSLKKRISKISAEEVKVQLRLGEAEESLQTLVRDLEVLSRRLKELVYSRDRLNEEKQVELDNLAAQTEANINIIEQEAKEQTEKHQQHIFEFEGKRRAMIAAVAEGIQKPKLPIEDISRVIEISKCRACADVVAFRRRAVEAAAAAIEEKLEKIEKGCLRTRDLVSRWRIELPAFLQGECTNISVPFWLLKAAPSLFTRTQKLVVQGPVLMGAASSQPTANSDCAFTLAVTDLKGLQHESAAVARACTAQQLKNRLSDPEWVKRLTTTDLPSLMADKLVSQPFMAFCVRELRRGLPADALRSLPPAPKIAALEHIRFPMAALLVASCCVAIGLRTSNSTTNTTQVSTACQPVLVRGSDHTNYLTSSQLELEHGFLHLVSPVDNVSYEVCPLKSATPATNGTLNGTVTHQLPAGEYSVKLQRTEADRFETNVSISSTSKVTIEFKAQ